MWNDKAAEAMEIYKKELEAYNKTTAASISTEEWNHDVQVLLEHVIFQRKQVFCFLYVNVLFAIEQIWNFNGFMWFSVKCFIWFDHSLKKKLPFSFYWSRLTTIGGFLLAQLYKLPVNL